MTNNYSKNNVLSSLFWKIMERGGTQGVQFIVQIILARLILPEEFGIIALVMVFVNFAQVFVQSGFSTALIQKKNTDELDFSSIFYLSLGVAAILQVCIYIFAPIVAEFYDDTTLVPALRALSFILYTGALNSVQNAYISRNLLFKMLFKSSLGATLISGTIGIYAAYLGFGVWALIVQQLVNQISITTILWFTVKWRPQLKFSLSRVKALFGFSWKLLVSSLIDTLYLDLRTLLIGRIFTPSILGFYNRGEQFPKLIVNNINGSIQSVMLPTLSAYQDDKNKMKSFMRRSIVTSSFIVFPLMIGMTVIATTFIKVVLGELWLPSASYLQVFCISYMFMPIHTANLQTINAMGRSDVFLKLEVIKKILGLVLLIFSIPFGPFAIAIGQLLNNIASSFINAFPNKKLLEYGYREQIIDVLPSLSLSIIMGVTIYPMHRLALSEWKILILQVLLGVFVYIILALISKNESYEYLRDTIKSYF